MEVNVHAEGLDRIRKSILVYSEIIGELLNAVRNSTSMTLREKEEILARTLERMTELR